MLQAGRVHMVHRELHLHPVSNCILATYGNLLASNFQLLEKVHIVGRTVGDSETANHHAGRKSVTKKVENNDLAPTIYISMCVSVCEERLYVSKVLRLHCWQ